MDIVIWAAKSLYKMIIVILLLELAEFGETTYDMVLMLSMVAAVFSSIPFSKSASD